MKKFWIIKGLKIGAFIILAVLAIGFVVMSLWNWLIPVLFKGPVINFCQALGILVLSKILFGGFKKGGGHGGCHCGHKGGSWKQRWEDKFSHLSPEEREKIKQKFGNKCRSWMGHSEEKEEKKD